MVILKPDGHAEQFVAHGEVVISKYENLALCAKGEWIAISEARNITFNDVFVTYLDAHGAIHHELLKDRFLTVYSHEEPIKEQYDNQISIFDVLMNKENDHE